MTASLVERVRGSCVSRPVRLQELRCPVALCEPGNALIACRQAAHVGFLAAADIAKVLWDDERAVLEAVHEITARLAEASLTANDGDGFREFFDSLGRPVEAAGSVVQA